MTPDQQERFREELTDHSQNGLDAGASFETCLAKLGESGTWGNHVTLQAIAHQLRDQVLEMDVKIVVYNTKGPRWRSSRGTTPWATRTKVRW
jgi:hypothetical protein